MFTQKKKTRKKKAGFFKGSRGAHCIAVLLYFTLETLGKVGGKQEKEHLRKKGGTFCRKGKIGRPFEGKLLLFSKIRGEGRTI